MLVTLLFLQCRLWLTVICGVYAYLITATLHSSSAWSVIQQIATQLSLVAGSLRSFPQDSWSQVQFASESFSAISAVL